MCRHRQFRSSESAENCSAGKGFGSMILVRLLACWVLAWREVWVLVQEWLSRIPDFHIKLSTQMLGIGMLSRVPRPELVQF